MDNFTQLPKRTKLALLGVALFAAGFIIFWLVLVVGERGKIAVEIKAAPRRAAISIDNRRVGGKAFLPPGTHTLTVSYDGFNTYQQTFELKPGDPAAIFTVALSPQTANAKRIAAAEAKRYAEIEGLGGQKAQEDNVAFQKNNPIVKNIPYKTSYYSIDYGKNEAGELVIQITAASPLGRQVALEKIRSWGYDPTDYRLVFVGLQNPFDSANPEGGS